MPDFTVRRFGSDTSGRPILMTTYMQEWWERVCAELGFTPTIVQGAFMAQVGGGASASAGYHDAGGCLDLRTWDRSGSEVDRIIRTTRRLGAGSWVRDQRHGMDPHIHLVLGSDQPLASGAQVQWSQYLNGRDGLARNGADYHWRPSPLVTIPPVPEEDIVASIDDLKDALKPIENRLASLEKIAGRSTNREIKTNALLRKLRRQVGDPATVKEIEALLADEDGDASPRR